MRYNPRCADEMIDFAKSMMMAKGNLEMAYAISEHTVRNESVSRLVKSAIDAGSTLDGNWAANSFAYRQMSAGFLESLGQISAFDAMLGSMRQVPVNVLIGAFTSAATGSSPGEGALNAVSRFTLSSPALATQLATCIVVVSEELTRSLHPVANRTLAAELKKGASAATNHRFLNTIESIANDSNAHSSSGGTALQIAGDLALLAKDVITSALCKPFIILSAANATAAAFKMDTAGTLAFPEMSPTGGLICGVQVLVSDELPSSTDVLLIDADAIAADGGVVVLDASGSADVRMSDSPSDLDSTDNATMLSMFQSNNVAMRATRAFGFELWRRSGAAVLTGCSW